MSCVFFSVLTLSLILALIWISTSSIVIVLIITDWFKFIAPKQLHFYREDEISLHALWMPNVNRRLSSINHSYVTRTDNTSWQLLTIKKSSSSRPSTPHRPHLIPQKSPIPYQTIPEYLPEKRRYPCWLYEHKVWKNIPGYEDQPLILYQAEPSESIWMSLGNQIGFYFKALGMAFVTGLPFYARLPLTVDLFVEYLPRVILDISNNSNFRDIPIIIVENPTSRMCGHQDPAIAHRSSGSWDLITLAIRRILRSAILRYAETRGVTRADLETDLSLQYRCGDILNIWSKVYGFMSYSLIEKLINQHKAGPRQIVIETNPLYSKSRNSKEEGLKSKCRVIVLDLVSRLTALGHNVQVANGSDRSLSWGRMMFSKQLICSASTYCFWPALAADESYFPDTGLLLSSYPDDLSQGWHWVRNLTGSFLAATTIRSFPKVEGIVKYLQTH